MCIPDFVKSYYDGADVRWRGVHKLRMDIPNTLTYTLISNSKDLHLRKLRGMLNAYFHNIYDSRW